MALFFEALASVIAAFCVIILFTALFEKLRRSYQESEKEDPDGGEDPRGEIGKSRKSDVSRKTEKSENGGNESPGEK